MSQVLSESYNLGLECLQQGKLDDAIAAYRKCLDLDPSYFYACNDLGVALWKKGCLEEAVTSFRRAMDIKPDFVDPYLNLGNVLKHQGKLEEAESSILRGLEIDPNYAALHNNLGILREEQNRLEEAAASLLRAIELNPDYPQAHFNLGGVLTRQDKFDEAISALRRSIELNPNSPGAYINLGIAIQDKACRENRSGELDEVVIDCYRKALELDPNNSDAHFNLGLSFVIERKFEEAVRSLQKAVEIKPDFEKVYLQLGNCWKELERLDEARSSYRKALELKSAHLESCEFVRKVGELLLELDCLPVVYKKSEDIERYRGDYSACLHEASRLIHDKGANITCEERRILKDVLFRITNFYLAYQQFNDKELQIAYSTVASEILRPELEKYSGERVAGHSDRKIRVGIASANLCNHNGSFWAYHWLKNLPSDSYEFYLYALNGMTDGLTKLFAELGTYRWLPFSVDDFENSIQRIKDDKLDILLLPDVGMTVPSRIISLFRLAPVQCVGWGHPMTTGSPNIDYYLSSDLMETDEADSHYSEKLVRLPNIGIYVQHQGPPSNLITRAEFGLPDDKVLYGSVQSVFKHLPQFDFMYPEIAKQVPDAFFVFVGNESDTVTASFEERIKNAFERAGLCFEEHAKVLPRLTYDQFMQLLSVIDVNLDSIGWTGGITTINSIIMSCPLVTLPGEFMRGRHSYAILKMIGVEELIAGSIDEYISLSARLGLDREWRLSIVEKIISQRERLYRDTQCIEYLDQFFKSSVREVRANSPIPAPVVVQTEITLPSGKIPFHYRQASSDEVVFKQIFVDQDYSLQRLKINAELDRFLATERARGLRPLIVDLGAYIGASAVWFAGSYPEARVVALEPDDENFKLLVQNTRDLDCIAIKGAVASEKCRVRMQDPGLGHFGLRTELALDGEIETFTVPELITRQDAGKFFPFIAKIDIEGAEQELFSRNTDWVDLFPVLIIELHDWVLPGTNVSRNFLQCISGRNRDFVHFGENIFSIRTPVDCQASSNVLSSIVRTALGIK